jgi:hypothetical protein
MSNMQSIIVYRNPAEAMLWESGMAFPLFSALVVGLVVFLAVFSALDRFGHLFVEHGRRSRYVGWGYRNQRNTYIAGAVAVIAGVLLFIYMM